MCSTFQAKCLANHHLDLPSDDGTQDLSAHLQLQLPNKPVGQQMANSRPTNDHLKLAFKIIFNERDETLISF